MTTPFRTTTACMLSVLTLALILVTLVPAPTPATAADEAGASRWILGLKHGGLKTVLLWGAGDRTTAYHYMTLEVTNSTRLARPWYPLVKAITDTKDKDGNNSVYIATGYEEALAAVRLLENAPDLKPVASTRGKIAAGATLKTVAIFGPLDSLYDDIRLEVHGLADSVATYKMDIYDGSEIADGDDITPSNDWIIGDSAYYARNQKIMTKLRAQAKADGDGVLPAPVVHYVVVSERRLFRMNYQRLGDEFGAEDDLISFVSEGYEIQGNPKKMRIVNEKVSE